VWRRGRARTIEFGLAAVARIAAAAMALHPNLYRPPVRDTDSAAAYFRAVSLPPRI
jgi:hypothetical protein